MPASTAGASPAAQGFRSHQLDKAQAQRLADSWPADDTAAAAFRFKAVGATEADARHILSALAFRGVRRVRAYVDGMTAEDVARWLLHARRADAASQARAAASGPAGGLLRLRTAQRWPWRVSSGQERGVSHG